MNLKPTFLTLALVITFALGAFAQQNPNIRALVFSKTAGFRHQSIPEGVAALKKLGQIISRMKIWPSMMLSF
jgi:uncharacterized protein